ncbi:MAG: hypothetical protein LBK44_01530 [Spirochaetales bacterium]|nr:hypothetical protein [Spirochaetales bacterium]
MQILWAFRYNPLRPTGFSRFAYHHTPLGAGSSLRRIRKASVHACRFATTHGAQRRARNYHQPAAERQLKIKPHNCQRQLCGQLIAFVN